MFNTIRSFLFARPTVYRRNDGGLTRVMPRRERLALYVAEWCNDTFEFNTESRFMSGELGPPSWEYSRYEKALLSLRDTVTRYANSIAADQLAAANECCCDYDHSRCPRVIASLAKDDAGLSVFVQALELAAHDHTEPTVVTGVRYGGELTD